MNIQIFGKTKCFASRMAERFFKERKIKYQLIDLTEKGLSARELDNVLMSIKDIDTLFDKKSLPYQKLNVAYISRTISDLKELLLHNPMMLVTPIVRDCDSKNCTVGAAESTWKKWCQQS